MNKDGQDLSDIRRAMVRCQRPSSSNWRSAGGW